MSQRCSWCGLTDAWYAQAISLGSSRRPPEWRRAKGRDLCSTGCEEMFLVRRVAEPAERDLAVREIDGVWCVEQAEMVATRVRS